MEFRLLGALEVRKGERVVAVGGAKQRALLAILLLHANEVVSRDRLIDELWSERAPGTAGPSLDHQVSRLRKALETDEVLVTRGGGYVLETDSEQIDVRRFERLLEEGRRANASGHHADAATLLRDALGLWRGSALSDFTYEPFARLEIERLEELRLVASEERFEAELALGHRGPLVPELESLTARHPLRERLRAQLMLALYRSGRQAEALRAYADTRRRLVDELGLEPGQELQQLEQAILRQDPALDLVQPETPSRRRRRHFAAALALTVAAVAAAAGVLLARGGTQSSGAQTLAQRNSVSFVSEASARVIGQTAAQAPVFSRFGLGALWNVSFAGVLNKIDPASRRILGFVNAVPLPCGLEVGERSIWVTDCTSPTVVRIDPKQVVPTGRYTLPVPRQQSYQASETGSVAVGAGSVWVGQGSENPSQVYRLDPDGHVQKRIVIPQGGAEALAFGDGALWVAGGVIGRLSKIDPRTNAVTTPSRDFGRWMCCVAVGGGYVWAAVGGTLWKISEDGQVVASTKLAASIADVRYADGAVWASVGDTGTVVRIDPTTDRRTSYRLGHIVYGVDARDGVLAVSVQSAAQDVTAGLHGRIVNVALSSDTLDSNSSDPVGVQSFNADQLQFHYATCAKLFNYPDAPGAAGKHLRPEVAAGWPKVTDSGRTYTFKIRPGYGFSPPSREPVTAASFRHEIERFLKQPGPWSLATLPDIVGAKAFNSGQETHVSGISAKGDTLVIRLLKPSGDLPTRLARPAFCAVPAHLPTVPGGLHLPIPTAGPYYLADRSQDVFVLKPNPNYHGPRPQQLDAIVYRTGIGVGDAVAQVGAGKVDYVQEQDPALAPNTPAAQTAGRRYRLTANNSTDRLALNTSRPLFADPRVRRAVEYALKRSVLAHALNGEIYQRPTNRLLPPNLSDDAGASFPLRANLPSARKLMSGRHLHAVLATYAPAEGSVYDPAFVAALRSQLAEIGISLRVVPLRQNYSDAKRAAVLAHADITRVETSSGDVDDVIGYLLRLPYLPTGVRTQLGRAAALPSLRQEAATARLADKLDRDAVYIGYADSVTPELVSKRLGCVIDQPEYPGVDLAALCVRNE
jgi:DNA-binding SARP family transcriptional activator/ABC-type transport system substrate-binding protein/streptogramin lyase